MKKMFKMGCLGFIGLVVLIVLISIFSDKDDSKTGNSNSTSSTVAAKQDDKAKEEEKKMAKIGEELQVGDVIFKVNKISTTKEIKDGNYLSYKPDADGSVFLVINVTVKNAGNEMITTDSSFFQLLKGEVKYAPTTLLTSSGDYFMYEGINPGLSQTGNVVYEIPEDLKDFVLNVQTGFWGTEQGQIQLQ